MAGVLFLVACSHARLLSTLGIFWARAASRASCNLTLHLMSGEGTHSRASGKFLFSDHVKLLKRGDAFHDKKM